MTLSDPAVRLEAMLSRRRTEWLSEEDLQARLNLSRDEIKAAADELALSGLDRVRLCERRSCGSRYYRIVVPRRPKEHDKAGSVPLFRRLR